MSIDSKISEDYLIAKVDDKISFCNQKNKITYSDFMQLNDKSTVIKYLKQNHIQNCFWFGGYENANREILVFYPDKITEEMARKNLSDFVTVIDISLPKELNYEHREYLSGIMKLGVEREKFGDIIVRENGASIVVFESVSDYFLNNLKLLKRFQKANITKKSIYELENAEPHFKDLEIIVSSLRLDNLICGLAHFSRSKAEEYIKSGCVYINGVCEMKESKKINIGEILNIRGKGKYIFDSISGNTRNDRMKLVFKKYV